MGGEEVIRGLPNIQTLTLITVPPLKKSCIFSIVLSLAQACHYYLKQLLIIVVAPCHNPLERGEPLLQVFLVSL